MDLVVTVLLGHFKNLDDDDDDDTMLVDFVGKVTNVHNEQSRTKH